MTESSTWLRPSKAVPLEPAIQRAATQTQGISRAADIAAVARQSFADQEALDILKAHVFDAGCARRFGFEPEMSGAHEVAFGHQHAPLHDMIEFAYISGPRVSGEHFPGRLIESAEGLPVAGGVLAQEMFGQKQDVVSSLP